MNHAYLLYKRGGNFSNGVSMPMPEEAIMTLLYNREIVHDRSVHVGTDKSMSHYFKFKEIV